MKVVAVTGDLMLFSRIQSAAEAADASLLRLDSPVDLPVSDVDLALVDWSTREAAWADHLTMWRPRIPSARLILFGRHTDLQAHADARAAGLGPMWARSKLVAQLNSLFADKPTAAPRSESPLTSRR